MLLESPPLARAPGGQRGDRRRATAVPPASSPRDSRTPRSAGAIGSSRTASRSPSRAPRSHGCARFRAFATFSPPGSYAPQLSATPQQIGAPALWGQTLDTAGQGVKIGIIDSGIDAGHPVLRPDRLRDAGGIPEGPGALHDREGDRRARLRAEERDCAASARVAFSDDDSSHGTHVAGIAAGNADTPAGGGDASRASRRARTSATTRCSSRRAPG